METKRLILCLFFFAFCSGSLGLTLTVTPRDCSKANAHEKGLLFLFWTTLSRSPESSGEEISLTKAKMETHFFDGMGFHLCLYVM